MRLLMHQVLKDVRLLRWPAVAWLALVAAFQAMSVRMALVPVQPALAPRAAFDPIGFSYVVLTAALVGLFAVIAVLLVQHDPAVGTTAFWLTRPVSLSALVGAKLLAAIVVLVVIPLGADIAAALVGGLTLGDASRVVPGALMVQLAWLLPLLALGAITATLAQFVLAAVIEIIVFVSAVSLLRGVLTRSVQPVIRANPPTSEVLIAVLVVALILFGLTAVVFTYRVRSFKRSAALVGVAPVVLSALLFVWPWSFSSWQWKRLPATFTVAAIPGSLRIEPPSVPTGGWWLSGAFRFSSVPPRQVLAERGMRIWIEYAAERLALDELFSHTMLTGQPDRAGAPLRAISQAVGVTRVLDPDGGQISLPGFGAAIPAAVYNRHQYDSGVFHATLVFIVNEEQTTSAVPLRAGERYHASGRSGRITSVSASPDGFSVTVVESRLRPMFAPPMIGGWGPIGYAARNRSLHLASLPKRSRDSLVVDDDAPAFPVPAHLTGNRLTFRFPAPEGVAPADWMRGAELVVIESRTLGDTVVHLTIPNVVLSSLRDITRPMPPK